MKAADNHNPFSYEKIHEGTSGGYLYDNKLHDHGKGWKEEEITARMLADAGEKLVLLPELNADTAIQQKLRDLCLPAGTKPGRNADGIQADGKILELKYSKVNNANSIDTLIRKGAKQADHICIRLTGHIDDGELLAAVKDRVARTENVKEVWILQVDGSLTKHTRKSLLK